MPYCIQCGKALHKDAQFCFHCGASIPSTNPTSSTSEPPSPPVASMPQPTQAPVSEAQEPKKKKSVARIIGYSIYFLIAALVVGLMLFSIFYIAGPRKLDAKEHAKREVEAAWQEFDENMELLSITYDTVNLDKWDEDEIDAYIAKYGNTGITDINGNKYDTHWDYWNSKGYDPYSDTYHFFTIKGNYHVTDRRKQDYEGWYCVTILHKVNENSWSIQDTELELPEELKQYLPD